MKVNVTPIIIWETLMTILYLGLAFFVDVDISHMFGHLGMSLAFAFSGIMTAAAALITKRREDKN